MCETGGMCDCSRSGGYNMDEVAEETTARTRMAETQEDGLPTGNELCDAYLEPLAGNSGDRRRYRNQDPRARHFAAGHRQGDEPKSEQAPLRAHG